jgi:cell division protein FtsA
MNKDNIVVGLDIGTTKICAIVGKQNEYGKINILGLGKAESNGVERGVVNNIDMTVEAIRLAVEEAEKQSGVDIQVVHVGIAGEHIRSAQHKGIITLDNPDREITAQDVERLHADMFKIATPPGDEIIHVLPQEYTVDGNRGVKHPVGMSGVRLEGNFHIITGQSGAANNIYKCVRKAGLEAIELVLEPLASSAAVLSEEEMEAGVCLVDIGGGTTDIAIFADKIIRHTAVIPFGGNTVTNDIFRGCHIMRRHAEELKVKFGSALSAAVREDEIISLISLKDRSPKQIHKRMLASLIEARMKEIMEFVAAEVHASGYLDSLVGGIVLTGGGSQLSHMKQLAEHVTGMDARIGSPGEHLAQGLVAEVNHPIFATGVGLVIHALQNEPLSEDRIQMTPEPRQSQQTRVAESKQPNLTPTEPKAPRPGFLDKVKNWFEGHLQNTGNFIE